MSQATRRRRLPAFAASTAMVAALLPLSSVPASAATAQARTIDDGCPETRVPDAGFNDTNGHLFEREIECIAWYGITTGRADGGYHPGDSVTRGAMAAFMVRLIEASGQTVDPTPPSAFDDVIGHVFEKQINQLAQLGVVGGYKDTGDFDNDGDTEEFIFRPGLKVTRGQMATFINGVHEAITGQPITSADDYFTDDNGTAHEANINAIASVGIAGGVTSTTYAQGRSVSRGAMGAFLSRQIDYLVELDFMTPPVDGVADVLLDSMKINQGRQAIGRILTEDDLPIKSATVDICGGEFGTGVSMNEDNFAFSFTIPFQAPVGLCELEFHVTLGDNRTEVESQTIEILKTDKTLLGPELVSIAIQSVGTDTVTIRYEFVATTNLNDAVEASKFRLYGFAGQQFSAVSASRVGDFSVEATFPRDQYDDATTGGIAQFAVQDQDGFQVAEYSFGLKDVRLNAGETEFPDLTGVTGSGNTLTFTFDAPVFEVAATDFAAVYSSNGVTSTVSGDVITNGGAGSNSFTVSFTPPEGGGVILRGVIKKSSIAAAAEGAQGNARQTEDVEGPSQSSSPHLTSVILDAANNQVQFVFSEAVTNNATEPVDETPMDGCIPGSPIFPCESIPGVGFQIYDITGTTYTSYDVVQGSNNTLIATFAQGQVTGLIQGGSSDQGVAKAARNAALLSGVDEFGRQNTFEAGQTAAPDLRKVTKVTDAEGNVRLTYTFDQSVAKTTGNPIGQFVMYAQDNTRFVVDSATCTVESVTIFCTLASGSPAFNFSATAVYGAVSYAAVNAGGNQKFNPEGGFLINAS